MPEAAGSPIVMRMEGLWPGNLAGYESHRGRKGGDLGHVDPARSHMNRRLIGTENWAEMALAEIEEMRVQNFANELEGLKRRRRKAELEKRFAEGARDPWAATRHGPMREIILTANREWFDAAGAEGEERFEDLAIGWLQANFGADCVHARADLDEQAYHIHAVIIPRAVTKDGRRMLQPSKHPLIRDYEAAQDSVGEWFAELGLVRGERRAAAIREAKRHNERIRREAEEGMPEIFLPDSMAVPQRREHVSPRTWREEQERKLADREAVVVEKEADIVARSGKLAGREAQLAARENTAKRQGQDLATRETAVTESEGEIRNRRENLDEREARLAGREVRAEGKYRAAMAVIAVATGVSEGRTEVAEEPDRALELSSDPAEIARHKAAELFGKALTRLRRTARAENGGEKVDHGSGGMSPLRAA